METRNFDKNASIVSGTKSVRNRRKDSGFTLVELITAVGIIGVLASISIQSFSVYKKNAYYSIATRTLGDARIAFSAAETGTEGDLPSLSTTISTGGETTGVADEILPGLIMPVGVSLNVSYNPSCDNAGCDVISLISAHCKGEAYTTWIRSGDYFDILVEKISGAGPC